MNKKMVIVIVVTIIIIFAGIGIGLYRWQGSTAESVPSTAELESIRQQYPDLSIDIDHIIKGEEAIAADPTSAQPYLSLGLAYKSIAEIAGREEYFAKAFAAYERGVVATQRRNTILLMNAGNVAKRMKNYTVAEEYYKEAISVAPDADYYIALAELYEDFLKKSPEEILAVYDEGLQRLVSGGSLLQAKNSYLQRIGRQPVDAEGKPLAPAAQ